MYHRKKILLALLDSFGGDVPSTDFQKYLFLYTQLCQDQKSYDFVPYRFGCFSFQSYADKHKLIESNYLKNESDWKLTKNKSDYLRQLSSSEAKKIRVFADRYRGLSGKKLIKHVYTKYPYFATKSQIAEKILTTEELREVSKLRVRRRTRLFATIGYEGISIEKYLNKLIGNDIRVVIDVRKNPISRKYGFSKNKLADLLQRVGIKYAHYPALGISSDKRQQLETEADYKRLFRNYEKTVLKSQEAELIKLYSVYEQSRRIAITCFEQIHTMCHRHKVADALERMVPDGIKAVNL